MYRRYIEMNEELVGKIEALVQAVQMIANKVDELAERVDQLDSVLFDGLIGPANDQLAQEEYDSALSDFRCKFGEKLEKYDGLAKAEEGDDEFDVVRKAFDTYNSNDDINTKMSPTEYVDQLAEGFAEHAKKLAELAGAAITITAETPEGEVEVKADEDGSVEVEGEAVEKAEVDTEEKEEKEDEDDSRSKWKKIASEMSDGLF